MVRVMWDVGCGMCGSSKCTGRWERGEEKSTAQVIYEVYIYIVTLLAVYPCWILRPSRCLFSLAQSLLILYFVIE